MRANIFLLYGSTVMIWGTTWLAIKFQLGSVDPMVSVLYRFVAAAMILIFYCKLLGLRMRFHLKDHVFMICPLFKPMPMVWLTAQSSWVLLRLQAVGDLALKCRFLMSAPFYTYPSLGP